MSITVTTPVTGSAQSGFTSPTYTVVADVAPDINGKQVAVTALGGTQVGVTVHSMASPFTGTFVRPKVVKSLGKPNPMTGLISSVPRNTFVCRTRKGGLPLAGQPFQNLNITTTIDLPAGMDTADPANVRAALSFHIGLLTQQTSGLGDLLINNVI